MASESYTLLQAV